MHVALRFVIVFLLVAAGTARAELLVYHDAHGRTFTVDPDDPNSGYRIPWTGPTKSLKQTSILFNVTFDDVENNTDFGFDDPTFGLGRRDVVERVFEYIDSVLDENGALDVLFQESLNLSGSSNLAFAGPFFNSESIFQNGHAFERITSGIDPNGGGSPEMVGQVNFGHVWFTGTGATPNGQFDLFTVLLHEITHGLGVLSFSDANGENSQGQAAFDNVFTLWDEYLGFSNGGTVEDVFANHRFPVFVGSPAMLISDALAFSGPAATRSFASAPPVSSPSPFSLGSSLSHFDQGIAGDAVMKPVIIEGTEIREYAFFELAALADLGYTTATPQFCGPADTPPVKQASLISEISGIPWDPSLVEAAEKVIYGDDNRLEVFEVTDPIALSVASATCALIAASDLTDNGNGTFTIETSAFRPGGRAVCNDEPFFTQPTAAFCSGFLVAANVIATAGHCVTSTASLDGMVFVFGFDMVSLSIPRLTVTGEQVYTGTSVLGRELNNTTGADFALVRLDRPVTAPGAEPLGLRREGEVDPGAPIGVIGHPSGLPKKIAAGDDTHVTANCNDVFFSANLDTYGGNSGSPVFDPATGTIEGILVRGAQDFLFLDTEGCVISNRLPDSAGNEEVTKAVVFAALIAEPPSSQGEVTLDHDSYVCGDTIIARLGDSDLGAALTVDVTITTSSGDEETLTLEEVDTGTVILGPLFEGPIDTAEGGATPGNGLVETSDGDTVTVTYNDADDGTGAPATVTDTAGVVCVPVLSRTPSSHNYGTLNADTSTPFAFTLSNEGSGVIVGSASVAGPFEITSGQEYAIGKGESHSVVVSFAPTAAGTFTRTVTFTGLGGATASVTGAATIVTPDCGASAGVAGGTPTHGAGDALVALVSFGIFWIVGRRLAHS